MVLQTSQSWLSAILHNLSSEPFMRVEVVLRLFYMLGEVITDKVCVGLSDIMVHQSFSPLIAAIWSCQCSKIIVAPDDEHGEKSLLVCSVHRSESFSRLSRVKLPSTLIQLSFSKYACKHVC